MPQIVARWTIGAEKRVIYIITEDSTKVHKQVGYPVYKVDEAVIIELKCLAVMQANFVRERSELAVWQNEGPHSDKPHKFSGQKGVWIAYGTDRSAAPGH